MNKIIMVVLVSSLFFCAPHIAMGDLYGDLTGLSDLPGNYSNTSLRSTILSCYWFVATILLYNSPPLKIKLFLIIGGIIGSITVLMIGEKIIILLAASLLAGFAWLCIEKTVIPTEIKCLHGDVV